jgi:SNF2 family DNA or RNA helicase
MNKWYVRRRKQDVLKDLPDKYYTKIWVDLDPKQRRAYDQMRKTMVAWVEDYKDELERNDPIIAQAVVAQLVRLQQFADGYMMPRLDEQDNQIIKQKRTKDGDYKDVPQWIMTDPSSKLDTLMDLLRDREDDQVVIFSQFKSVINLLQERLQAEKITYGLLTGDVSQQDRANNVQAFQSGALRVFVGTIAAGGVGITLTAASTVIFIDRSWSPAINLQAEDRCHRIGQKEAVEIIDLMARNTVDLGKAQQLAVKWKWLQMLLGDKVEPEKIINELQLEGVDNDKAIESIRNEYE